METHNVGARKELKALAILGSLTNEGCGDYVNYAAKYR